MIEQGKRKLKYISGASWEVLDKLKVHFKLKVDKVKSFCVNL